MTVFAKKKGGLEPICKKEISAAADLSGKKKKTARATQEADSNSTKKGKVRRVTARAAGAKGNQLFEVPGTVRQGEKKGEKKDHRHH